MDVVPVQLPLICARSKVRISIPADLRPLEGRQSILLAVQELGNRFPEGLPKRNPVKVDMKIEDPENVEVVNKNEELERKLHAHPLHKVCHIIQNQLPSAHCGASFSEVIPMTDIFEGSIIRSSRRLDEFLNQVICEIFSLKHHLLSLCYFSPRTKLLRGPSCGPNTIFSKTASTKSRCVLLPKLWLKSVWRVNLQPPAKAFVEVS